MVLIWSRNSCEPYFLGIAILNILVQETESQDVGSSYHPEESQATVTDSSQAYSQGED